MNPQERAAYRAFLREHHPDRGGDPTVFAAGLARFRDAQRAGPEPDPAAEAPFPVRVAVALIRTVRRQRQARVGRASPP
ncbi:hypothetical protein ACFQE5_11720 [Pseudonocardia hispaniensis]|uniref:J domain-containing protein n=1 Tax=Pseudonocardia hispaniensis TaxID=904933 RepID=A0ABW1J2F7_9PSEU